MSTATAAAAAANTAADRPRRRGLFRRLFSASHSSLRQNSEKPVVNRPQRAQTALYHHPHTIGGQVSNTSLVSTDAKYEIEYSSHAPLSSPIAKEANLVVARTLSDVKRADVLTPPTTPPVLHEKRFSYDDDMVSEDDASTNVKVLIIGGGFSDDEDVVDRVDKNPLYSTSDLREHLRADSHEKLGPVAPQLDEESDIEEEEISRKEELVREIESSSIEKEEDIANKPPADETHPIESTAHESSELVEGNVPNSETDDLNIRQVDSPVSTELSPEETFFSLATQVYDGDAPFVPYDQASSWIGDSGNDRAQIRKAYMSLFDFDNKSVLASVRLLCERLYMKAESQQLDRIIDAFSDRWCECNIQHGFKNVSVIYTLAYSILLLNTDHHSEEYQGNKKMPRSQYINQTLNTVRQLVQVPHGDNASVAAHDMGDAESVISRRTGSMDYTYRNSLSGRKRWSFNNKVASNDNTALVCDTSTYNTREWENIMIGLLKNIYASIDLIPLHIAAKYPSNRLQPTTSRGSFSAPTSRGSILSRLSSRSKTPTSEGWSDYDFQDAMLNNGSSAASVTGKRSALGDTTDGSEGVGFMSALRNTMIKEEASFINTMHSPDLSQSVSEGSSSHPGTDDLSMTTVADPDDPKYKTNKSFEASLVLHGAPWAKEGLLKFQGFYDGVNVGKKYKKRDFLQVFVVVQQGYLKIFRFDKGGSPIVAQGSRSSHLSPRRSQGRLARPGSGHMFSPTDSHNRPPLPTPQIIGSGNWLDNATLTDNIDLSHCMAQVNPLDQDQLKNSIGKRSSLMAAKSDADSTQWSLTLPGGGIIVFLAGTREIAEEYVYACNYWASRISKEPLLEAVSNMEYGWEKPINLLREHEYTGSTSLPTISSASFDTLLINYQRVQVKEWHPPILSTVHSELDEARQVDVLQKYIKTLEQAFEAHSAVRADMMQIFQPTYLVSTRAHGNWEKRSGYLLKEMVKYDAYVTTLQKAMADRQKLELIETYKQEVREAIAAASVPAIESETPVNTELQTDVSDNAVSTEPQTDVSDNAVSTEPQSDVSANDAVSTEPQSDENEVTQQIIS